MFDYKKRQWTSYCIREPKSSVAFLYSLPTETRNQKKGAVEILEKQNKCLHTSLMSGQNWSFFYLNIMTAIFWSKVFWFGL